MIVYCSTISIYTVVESLIRENEYESLVIFSLMGHRQAIYRVCCTRVPADVLPMEIVQSAKPPGTLTLAEFC